MKPKYLAEPYYKDDTAVFCAYDEAAGDVVCVPCDAAVSALLRGVHEAVRFTEYEDELVFLQHSERELQLLENELAFASANLNLVLDYVKTLKERRSKE